jgi:NAD(P)H-hydrate epimerase
MSPLPDWLEPLPDAAQQRALDAWAIGDRAIPGATLMERAGAGLARVCAEIAPEGRVAVVCGRGNNGGDGLVTARLLREQGRDVTVLMLGDPADLQGDARLNLERLPGPPPVPFAPAALDGVALIVDAILGTGFSGTTREPAASAIVSINGRRDSAAVVACDVPSGVDASTGEVASEAVCADATVTFHAAKPGLWISPGKAHAGALTVVDIGIPPGYGGPEPQIGLITDRVLEALPRRGASSTKFTAGAVLVCGGSRGLTGAPALAALAAARAGSGYVTVAVPDSLVEVLAMKLLEIMQVGLPEQDGALAPVAAAAALERAERVQSVVLGPGLGREQAAQAFARDLAAALPVALVLDADGLNAHAGGGLQALSRRDAPTVLTPHAGELGRLMDLTSDELAARRLEHAREASRRSGAIVVLKGDDTLVADPDGRVAVSAGNAPALATAGTGDVLSGVIAAALAKGVAPFTAACAGVFAHAQAGRLAAAAIGAEGVIASDVIAQLPQALEPRR